MVKVELSENTKTNIKAAILTIVAVGICTILLVLLLKNPVEFVALVIVGMILALIGTCVYHLFHIIKGAVEAYNDDKQRRR